MFEVPHVVPTSALVRPLCGLTRGGEPGGVAAGGVVARVGDAGAAGLPGATAAGGASSLCTPLPHPPPAASSDGWAAGVTTAELCCKVPAPRDCVNYSTESLHALSAPFQVFDMSTTPFQDIYESCETWRDHAARGQPHTHIAFQARVFK